ncbi:MAG TPA: type IX secretion system sortase PorU, partial [Bacteroidales bacterium]|nr:type IX secretion system sortase PorU [Bacteroidales bacterium]
YSDYAYYFVTCNNGQPREIQEDSLITFSATNVVNSFIDYQFHENNLTNLIRSGQQWYGEAFDYRINTYDFSFSFPNLISSNPVKIKMGLVARSSSSTTFTTQINGTVVKTSTIGSVSLTDYTGDYARYLVDFFNYNANSSSINMTLTYNYPDYSSIGWLDYICVNAHRNLLFSGSQMAFRNPESIGTNNITEFQISNANNNITVWDVTDPLTPIKKILYDAGSDTKAFKEYTDSLPVKQFVAFDFSEFKTPVFVKKVANQNLHQIQDLDFLIVTPDIFKTQADELAQLHRDEDGLNTAVFTNDQIYNEFSSGTPDVAAIRNFARMLYERSSNFKYLLLYGDGSYDNKTNSTINSNYILTYQSENSLTQSGSYVTDDFFGLLDTNEGGSTGYLDIGIGRFPVRTQTEANIVLDKIKHYYDPSTMGDWRNVITFIADDEDNNLHIGQANNLATQVDTSHPEFNIEKIYLDAYEQISTSSGESYPDAKAAIDNRIKKGCLIMNYTGHGGERGLSAEYIITIDGIKQWDNYDNLPLFVTATCEFSRYDDFEYTTAGEYVLLNSKGGGIALLSTTRLVYAGPNYILNKAFFSYVFENNYNYRLGDLVRLTKIVSGTSNNKRNFSLLGDPAMKLAYPKHHIVVTTIPDTLIPMTKVTISGEIQDDLNQKVTDFNGTIYPTIFDKRDTITTLSNDGAASPPYKFSVQNKILYKGKASVNNGNFSFSFIVPKDISYKNGFGKISFYANDSIQDALGYNDTIIIGGTAVNPIYDDEGPDINLYINTLDFQDGGITNESPVLIAYVSDSSGINTVGNGIGHDITAILDGNSAEAVVLNEFYESDLDSYQKGKVIYYFNNLSEGFHTLSFKVWDVMNNSSEQDISFEVVKSDDFVIDNVFNYPNPFSISTNFYFDHNQSEETLFVSIEIYDIMGRVVRRLQQTLYPEGYRSGPIVWEGTTSEGVLLPSGIYPYRIIVELNNGVHIQKSNKLVIVR